MCVRVRSVPVGVYTCLCVCVCARAHVTARLGYSYRNKPLYGLLIMPYGSMFYGHIMSTRPFSLAQYFYSRNKKNMPAAALTDFSDFQDPRAERLISRLGERRQKRQKRDVI